MKKTPIFPPPLGEALLKRLFPGIEGESIAGDLAVLFEEISQERGPVAARLWYARQIFKSIRTAAAVRRNWSTAMFQNDFKIAFRNLVKYRAYSWINILGLSLGIACCILIFTTIAYEFSFDNFHENADRIHRLILKRTVEGQTQEMASAGGPVGPTLIQDFPEVTGAVRISPTVIRSFRYRDKNFFEDGVFYVEKSIFKVFSFELIKGDPETALSAPYTMVLTEDIARKYFGEQDPLGEVLNWDNSADYTVTGVVRNPPANSHFVFNALASLETYFKYDPRLGNRWTVGGYTTYLLLEEGADPKKFQHKLPGFVDRYLGQIIRESGGDLEMYLQPLKNIHLNAALGNPMGPSHDIRLIRAFAAIALIILGIACINFMNLSTARSASRAREVGVRKVLGAGRKRLIAQFLGESFFNAGLSLMIALALARLILPYFNHLAGQSISLGSPGVLRMGLALAGILVFVGFFAGSYPALFLSAFQPARALRSLPGLRKPVFRSILVVAQFTVTVTLMICTLIIFNQQKYMQNKDLGFNKSRRLVIALQNEHVRRGLESFKTSLMAFKGVAGTCATSMVPGERYLFNTSTTPEGFSDGQTFDMDHFHADHDFFKIFEIELEAGRGFSKENPTDITDAVLINRTAADKLGWQNPLGKIIHIPAHPYGDDKDTVPRTVIGVFRDIHQRSLYFPILPTLVEHTRNEGAIEYRARRLTVVLDSKNIPESMAAIENLWKEHFPGHPYRAFFLDESYNDLHLGERRLAGIFRAFSLLAVFIGCLGLLGLAAFSAEQRTKEIGIRKVFGSTVTAIMLRLNLDIFRLIALANLIAWPIAYLAMRRWLQNFPYPVGIGWKTFAAAALLSLIVGLATVGQQSFRAARENPIDSLRYE